MKVEIGALPPDWFWEAIADGRIGITGAKEGDVPWGQYGVDALTKIGWQHIPLGQKLSFKDLVPPS